MPRRPARTTLVEHDPLLVIKARLRSGLSQRQLAKHVMISSGTMSTIESGVRGVGPDLLARIAAVLDCTPESLMRRPAA